MLNECCQNQISNETEIPPEINPSTVFPCQLIGIPKSQWWRTKIYGVLIDLSLFSYTHTH